MHGIHPDTHKPYDWYGGAPGKSRAQDLPYIHEHEAQALIDDAVALLVRDFGYRPNQEKPKRKDRNGAGQRRRRLVEYSPTSPTMTSSPRLAMKLLAIRHERRRGRQLPAHAGRRR